MNLPAARIPTVTTGHTRTMHTGELLNDYLTELRIMRRSANTIRVRRIQVRRWLDWLTVRDLTPIGCRRADIIRFLDGWPDPETRSAYRSAVRGFHSWLALAGWRDDDPSARIPSVTCPQGDPHPIPDAVLTGALADGTPRVRSMLVLGRFAGLRAAEIAAAHGDYLRVGAGGPVVRVQGKGARWRELPAHPLVVPLLSAADGWLYPSQRRPGEHIGAAAVSTALSRALGDWTAHSLRHAFATEAYQRTHDLVLVQRWMGHTKPTTTVRYVATDHDWAAMDAMHLVA